MSRLNWRSLLSVFAAAARSRPVRDARQARLGLEELEVRAVPSATPTVDLTTAGAIGEINGAIFRQFSPQPTGTGYIDSFVRLQAKGAGTQAEQGFNTDARPLQFDENKSPQFTRSLQLNSVPLVDIGGVQYREFLLDINQKASQPLLSLDQLRLYTGGAGNLSQLAGANLVYDMGAANWVKLNSQLSTGSGSGDMLLYVPNSDFGGGSYVYLYSNFGANYMATSGFEEWATGHGGVSVTAQTGNAAGSISGTVYLNGAPLKYAVVFIGDTYTNADVNGYYSFSGLATGLGTLSDYTVTVNVPSGDTTSQSYLVVDLQMSDQQVGNVNFYLTQLVPPPPTQGA
jgi:hypothetical protein